MFAQMASIHQWNPSILEQAGGLTGLYVAHFEDFFESNTAPPRRAHAMPAAIDILTQLLPSEEQSVRDIQLSASEIQQHMGRQCSVAEIEFVCSLLVDELKVVVELETSDAFPEGLAFDSLARVDTRKYRIGHDLQVPPIRMWTEQATQITATGRSVARFRELARMWERRPDERFLPSLGEYLAIRRGAKVLNLTEPQARYLAATNAYFLRRGILASGLLCVLGLIFGLAWFQHRVAVETKLLMINSKLDGLISSDVGEVPRLLDELETLPDRRRVLEIANRWMQVDGKRTKTRCTLLVSRLDPKQLNSLYAKIADIEPALGAEVVELAERHPESKQYLLQRISQQSDPVALARAAITLGATGDQQALTSLLAADKGLGLVNLLLDEATRWRAPPSMWLELVANSTGLMRYHALVALGSYPDAVLAQLPGIESFLLGELGSQNSSLHSISRWLCERLGIDTGAVTAPPLAQWEITPSGMELIRIPLHELEPRRSGVVIRGRAAGDASQVAQRHVWITSKAISSELMDRFYRQSLGEPALDVSGHLGGLTRGFPAVAVENDDIAGLCNWLSELDGLEPVYTFADSVTTDSKNVGEQKPARTFTAEASRTGYRLATVEELANAHLITSPAAYGTEFVANMFRAVQGSGREQFPNVSWQVQSNLPNRLGVFCNDNSGWILAGNDHFGQVFGFGTEGNFVEIDVGKLDSVFVQHRIFLSRPE